MNKFKYINRHHKKDIVLLPGWATDHRIFGKLDIEYNYIVPEDFDPSSFSGRLVGFLQDNGFRKVSLFGWSMGGFAAADFAVKNSYLIEEIILIGVKEKYDESGIEKVRGYLNENKRAYLYKFYRECFSGPEKEVFNWFKDNLMAEYLDLELPRLMNGLDYLAKSRLDTGSLGRLKTRFVYGTGDKIVPAGEIMALKKKMPRSEFVFVDNSGHIPFPSCPQVPLTEAKRF